MLKTAKKASLKLLQNANFLAFRKISIIRQAACEISVLHPPVKKKY